MLRFLSDENFNGDLVRGLLLRKPDLDIVRVQDSGLMGAGDPEVLAWAADEDRLVLTHDRATMPSHAFRRVVHAKSMAGVIVVSDRLPAGRVIDELLLVAVCSEAADWVDRVLLPAAVRQNRFGTRRMGGNRYVSGLWNSLVFQRSAEYHGKGTVSYQYSAAWRLGHVARDSARSTRPCYPCIVSWPAPSWRWAVLPC